MTDIMDLKSIILMGLALKYSYINIDGKYFKIAINIAKGEKKKTNGGNSFIVQFHSFIM